MKKIVFLVLAIVFSGCGTKQKLTQPVEPVYEFQKLDTTGVYIDLKSKEKQKLCSESLIELNSIWLEIQKYYDYQIDTYYKTIRSKNGSKD